MIRPSCPLFLLIATTALLFQATSAHATDVVVTAPNCNEAGLVSALNVVNGSGSGKITFSCGAAPITIAFSSYKAISANVVIDGADKITFDGNNISAFFQVYFGKSLSLKRLSLQHGVFNNVHALESFGKLVLANVLVKNNVSPGSVIQLNGGEAHISASTFTDNAITGTSAHGVVLDNVGGDVTIADSNFINNGFSTAGYGGGGAIENGSSGQVEIHSSTFAGNHALDGGAIDNNSGSLKVSGSTFTGNTASYGGAIESFGDEVTVTYSRFVGNEAIMDGGAIWNVQGMLAVDHSEFVGNRQTAVTATGGGAISCYGGALNANNSAFAGNNTAGNGGAIYSECGLAAINSTFYQNEANATSGGGGAIALIGSTQGVLQYNSIVGNLAAFGAVYDDGNGGGTLFLSRTILADNTGGSCAGVLTSLGYNLSDDNYCGGVFDPTTDLSNANLPLGPYQNNGGPTPSMLPANGNQAIDRVPASDCYYNDDQRGALRPVGNGCDSGAVERNGVIDVIFDDGFDFQ